MRLRQVREGDAGGQFNYTWLIALCFAMLIAGGVYIALSEDSADQLPEHLELSIEQIEPSAEKQKPSAEKLSETPHFELLDQLPEEYKKLKKCFIYGYEVAEMSDIVGFHSEMETYQRTWSESLTLSGIETDFLKEHPKEANAYYQEHCLDLSKPLNIKHGFDSTKP